MSWNDMPGLGTATGTRVDSAAKHIMACKVDTRLLACWLPDESKDAVTTLHADKMKWCMHKDEVVLNTSKNSVDVAVKAYPMVVTTVGDMRPNVRKYIRNLYNSRSASEFFTRQNLHESKAADDVIELKRLAECDPLTITDEQWTPIYNQISSLPDFRCQGIALGQAWASYLSGDTVASVLVGGMVTVQNGHFTMHTGDLVQWYFDFEKDLYDSSNKITNGARMLRPAGAENQRGKRERYMDERLYGSQPTLGKGSYKNSEAVVRIKSYRMHTVNSQARPVPPAVGNVREYFAQDHYGDKIRVFAKCVSGGRPFDAVDIMLMTQSL